MNEYTSKHTFTHGLTHIRMIAHIHTRSQFQPGHSIHEPAPGIEPKRGQISTAKRRLWRAFVQTLFPHSVKRWRSLDALLLPLPVDVVDGRRLRLIVVGVVGALLGGPSRSVALDDPVNGLGHLELSGAVSVGRARLRRCSRTQTYIVIIRIEKASPHYKNHFFRDVYSLLRPTV